MVYGVFTEDRNVWIDLLVSNSSNEILLIEIKTFGSSSFIEDLANAIGKYMLYSAILEYVGLDYKLYLVLPIQAYDILQKEDIGEIVLGQLKMSLVVYDPKLEVITQWIK
ncbi:MAG: element excision factor XisH family protein [Chloroflexota bacterium]